MRTIPTQSSSNPKYALAYEKRGAAYAFKNELKLAVADNTEALRIDPTFAWAYASRGEAYAAKNNLELAIADYTEAIRLDPTFVWAHGNRGKAYAAQGDLERVIADYTEAIRLDPNVESVYLARGFAYTNKQEYDRAISDYTEVLRLAPSVDVYQMQGYTNFYAGDYMAAVNDLTNAVQQQPDFAYPVLWLYLAHARSGSPYGVDELADNAAKLKSTEWPYPLIGLLLGHRSAGETLATANTEHRQCQAHFTLASRLCCGAIG